MKLHTHLSRNAVIDALLHQKKLGNIADSVYFDQLDEHRSKTHPRRFDVKLGSVDKVDGDGRRLRNEGRRGARSDDSRFAATYDEWGWFFAEIFRNDPAAACVEYDGRPAFLVKTGYAYNPTALLIVMATNGMVDPYPFVLGRVSGRSGRAGAGRSDGSTLSEPVRKSLTGTGPFVGFATDAFYRPRTIVEVATQVAELAGRERAVAEEEARLARVHAELTGNAS